ncbi:MAG: O-antigen ligase family protein [Xanthobacteraceae bacterium]
MEQSHAGALAPIALNDNRVTGESSLRARTAPIADGLLAAIAVALPWSTSATAVLIVLWFIAVTPLGYTAVRRELLTASGGLPVLLWTIGALGMLWADVSWTERLDGVSGFHKLLFIPLVLAHFRAGGRPLWPAMGFLASCTVLLIVSWVLFLTPGLSWRGRSVGVPVKDYILQSTVFAICALALLWQGTALWRRQFALALAMLMGAAVFMANILYVAAARTMLVVLPVLLALFGWRRFGGRGVLAMLSIVIVMVTAAWLSSPYFRARVSSAITDVERHEAGEITAAGLRLDFWEKSLGFVAEAPVIGHGTGAIGQLFRRDAAPGVDPQLLTDNPHNQLLTVALQVGLPAAAVLVALWMAHITLLHRASTLVEWIGLMIAVENVIGSLFNSFLFDFGQGWLYVFGVGMAGGEALRRAAATGPVSTTHPACP